jgi:2-amino-4-hydroxy-6-hydroxymethyldihydropteridine diphosphokinase
MSIRNVYIGLGANLGDREKAINSAIEMIELELVERKMIKSLTCSGFYETEAWGMLPESPDFLNCVVCLETDIRLVLLLDILLEVERELGRKRTKSEGYSDRVIDCDILVAGDEVVYGAELVVPHPRLFERRFMLQPLFDLQPNLMIPLKEKSVSELLEICDNLPEVKKWALTHS